MSKAFVFGFAIGLALLAVIGVGASRRQRDVQRDAKEEKARAELAQFNEEVVDATNVQLGVLTDTQRIHSRFYTYYREVRGGKSISDIAGRAQGKSKIVETMVLTPLGPVLTELETPKNYFAKLAHESDAIISGRVASKVSQITEDDSFIFTDYKIIIAEVLKNNITAPVETAGATITITRPGGKIVLDGVIVKARDASFAPLPLNNDVLLFLKFISATGSYRVTEATGAFELDGLSFHPLTTLSFPPGVLEDKTSLLQTVRAVSKDSR